MTELKQHHRKWIAPYLDALPFVEWDRFVPMERGGTPVYDFYGWIDRDDEHADFIWARFWTVNEVIEYTTSSAEMEAEIDAIWFDNIDEKSECKRVEHYFDIPNAIELSDND